MPYKLPELPYKTDALAPHISEQTMSFHYGKHHQGYVDKLNKLLGDDAGKKPLEDVIKSAAGKSDKTEIFNNAGQVWNHTFFWSCMAPKGGGRPAGALSDMIDDAFGSQDKFNDTFVEIAVGQFGSGWAWLIADDSKLKVIGTANADTPLVHGQTAILTCDVWEHAYYLDYQNRREEFVQNFLKNLVNWEFAAQNFASTKLAKAA